MTSPSCYVRIRARGRFCGGNERQPAVPRRGRFLHSHGHGSFSISWKKRGTVACEPGRPEARLKPADSGGRCASLFDRGMDRPAQPPDSELADGTGIAGRNGGEHGSRGMERAEDFPAGCGASAWRCCCRSCCCAAWAPATGSSPELWERSRVPACLVDLLLGSVFVAGVMAVALVIYTGRVLQTIAQHRTHPDFARHIPVARIAGLPR